MSIRAIMFDLDGTLIDQFDAIHRAFSRVLIEMGFTEPSYDEVKRAVGGASETTMSKLIGVENAKDAVKLLRPIFEEEMLIGLRALPGSLEILKICEDNQIQTGVLTNKHGPHARAACEHLGFSKYLNFIVGANDTKWKKPDPKLTAFAMSKFNMPTPPEQTLYFGDSPYDYETARQADLKCILVPTGTHDKQELSNLDGAMIEDDIPSFIRKSLLKIIKE